MSEEAYWRMDYCVEKTVRARKHHMCGACKRRIQPGELYRRMDFRHEGSYMRVKRCGACETTYRHLVDRCWNSPYELAVDMELNCGKSYENEWGEVPPEIARLPFLAGAEASALLEDT